MKTKESESRIHDNLYLVSFMNPNAMDAAMICNIIEIIRAISRTIKMAL
jgi:hypothetical protein